MNSLKEKEMTIRLYTDQLHNILRPIMFAGFQSLFDTAFKVSPEDGLSEFVKFLRAVPSWNNDMLKTEVERIKFESKMNDYLDQLFNIIIYTIIILMTMTPQRKKKSIKCPDDVTFQRFVHTSYILSAEKIFSNHRLFVRSEDELLNQKNIVEINSIIDEGLDTAITNMLPLKYILDNYVGDNDDILTEQLQTIHSKIATDHASAHLSAIESQKRINTEKESSKRTNTEKDKSKSDSEEDIVIDNNSIRPSESKKSAQQSSKQQSSKPSEKTNNKNNDKNVQHHTIPLLDIPNVTVKSASHNPEESEPYHLRTGKRLDVFSNKEYAKVSSSNNHKIKVSKNKSDSGDVDTNVVRKYVNSKNPSRSESSMQNYVPDQRTKNTKV